MHFHSTYGNKCYFFSLRKKYNDTRNGIVTEIYDEEDYARFIESIYAENDKLDDSEALCTYEGVYVNLYSDIDYSKVQKLCGNENFPEVKKFGGTFDGNGHKIYNLKAVSEDRVCLFYKLYGAVANLMVDDSC